MSFNQDKHVVLFEMDSKLSIDIPEKLEMDKQC